MDNVWNKHSEPWLYVWRERPNYENIKDLNLTKLMDYENEVVSRQVTHTWLTCTHHDQCVDQVW
jgi:hypothetical protein